MFIESFVSPTVKLLTANPMNDFEVVTPPGDSVSALSFSPAALSQNYLIAGSWDTSVRCWEVEQTGKTIPKSMQSVKAPILDVCWNDDGTKVFIASTNNQANSWDVSTNQLVQVATHDGPVSTCHWIKGTNYTCLMTGSWDKTLKFWDMRSPMPILSIQLPERCYCADVDYPLAIVGTAGLVLIVYTLDGIPREYKRLQTPLKYQYRCVSIFKDVKGIPAGCAVGSVEGRVSVQHVNPSSSKDNYTFRCHRSSSGLDGVVDIYAVNDIAFHPVHWTLATVGSNGSFNFWDTNARSVLKRSKIMQHSITKCAFNCTGQIFAYAVGYDWANGHEFYDAESKNHIFLRSCFDELRPRTINNLLHNN